jgi:hypothetical protein
MNKEHTSRVSLVAVDEYGVARAGQHQVGIQVLLAHARPHLVGVHHFAVEQPIHRSIQAEFDAVAHPRPGVKVDGVELVVDDAQRAREGQASLLEVAVRRVEVLLGGNSEDDPVVAEVAHQLQAESHLLALLDALFEEEENAGLIARLGDYAVLEPIMGSLLASQPQSAHLLLGGLKCRHRHAGWAGIRNSHDRLA